MFHATNEDILRIYLLLFCTLLRKQEDDILLFYMLTETGGYSGTGKRLKWGAGTSSGGK